jgi:hypothetical protein
VGKGAGGTCAGVSVDQSAVGSCQQMWKRQQMTEVGNFVRLYLSGLEKVGVIDGSRRYRWQLGYLSADLNSVVYQI